MRVKSTVSVAPAPAKPLVIFDGDCRFCSVWVRRWQRITGDRVEYVPFQDPRVACQFPGLPREQLETAVRWIDTEGAVYSGAEAVLRALATNERCRWPLTWYQRSGIFARGSELGYRLVARNRRFFSMLTRFGWGEHVEPSTYELARWVFLRSLGLIYLIAFVSLLVQIAGLIGSDGILPAARTMTAVREQADTLRMGWERYHAFPTLCWFGCNDGWLQFQCAAGCALAGLLLLGIAPAPCLFLLWLLYLSLSTIFREFLGFQWDLLLLETGFLAIFLAPLQLRLRLSRASPPSRVALWLLRWLLFRLMFSSGCVKLLSGDRTWRNLSALDFHYQTQPLPTWIGWYAHQLPRWMHTSSTILMFVIELLLPFLIFGPRRARQVAAAGVTLLQLAILLTGNYGFFNLLALALCLLLLDDAALRRLVRGKCHLRLAAQPQTQRAEAPQGARNLSWPHWLIAAVACVVVLISLVQLCGTVTSRPRWPRPVVWLYDWQLPFRTINTYGLLAVMTTSRPEIIIEGSRDGVTWMEYQFKYKPGDVRRRPAFVAPYQPRLDWQMWFAALGHYQQNPWFVNFGVRLLQGSPQALALLGRNPFPGPPPRYLRAVLYEYRFTNFATRRRTGAWWWRERTGDYLPVISLNHGPSYEAPY